MKFKHFLFILLFILFIFSACSDGDNDTSSSDSTGDNSTDTGTTDTEDTSDDDGDSMDTEGDDTTDGEIPLPEKTVSISKVYISDVNNLIFQPQNQQSSTMSLNVVDEESGIKTLENGELIDIEIEGGFGKTAIAGYAIKGSSLIKGAVSFQDSSGDITTCLIDQSNNCTEIKLTPQKTSKYINSPAFIEQSGMIYFRTKDKKLKVFNASAGLVDNSLLGNLEFLMIDIAENVDQFEIDNSNAIMYESLDEVILRKLDGTEILMDGDQWNGDNQLMMNADNKNFFIARKSGFTFYSQWGYFGNLFFDENGDPVTSHAQPIAWDSKMNQGLNGVYYAVNTNKSPSNCSRHNVRQIDYIICGNEVFKLGDAVTDIEKINFVWAGIEGDYTVRNIIANNEYLYLDMYSESLGGRLTRVDPENIECSHLFSASGSNMYNQDLGSMVLCQSLSNDLHDILEPSVDDLNVIIACSINGVIQIKNADTDNPIITETHGECSQIVSL